MTSSSHGADWAVVLAGGVGARFWPMSRRDRPKQCLSLGGGPSLLRRTLDRLEGVVPPHRVLVVTGPAMADAVRAQLPDLPENHVLVEPSGRNTAPPMAWGTLEAARRGADRVLVLPSDHRVEHVGAFRASMRQALAACDDALVLIGVRPTHAETGYGWIEVDGEIVEGQPREVARFTEKPERARAEALLAAGALWNGGMFCWRPATLRAAVTRTLPGLAAALREIDVGAPVTAVWDRCEATSIDHGVLERLGGPPAPRRVVVPSDFGWTDLGSWAAVAEVLPEGPLGRAQVAAGLAIDGGDHVIHAPGKLVVTVGVEGLVVVDTGDALLVCRKEDSQRVGEVVGALRAAGLHRYT